MGDGGVRPLDLDKECGQFPYMTQSTLTAKNQTTIPKAVIEALKLRPSDQLVYEIEPDGRVVLSAKTGTFASVAASLSRKPGPARSVGEMNAAVKAAAVKRFKHSGS
jgi:bifunctional DNA-binding transcriptional regulator/antitoxin component of YhaV-PrlF toxin-antitoxin module